MADIVTSTKLPGETYGSDRRGPGQPQFSEEDVRIPDVARDPGVRPVPPSLGALSSIPEQQQSALSAIERANAQFQNDIATSARAFEELHQKRQGWEDQAFADRYQLEYNKKAADITTKALNSPDAAHPQFVSKLDEQLATEQENLFSAFKDQGVYMPSQRGIEAARSSAMSIRSSTARTAAVDANNQRVGIWLDAARTDVLDVARDAAATGNLEGGQQRALAITNRLQGVLSPDNFIKFKNEVRQQLTTDVARGYIDRREYDKAFAILDQNRTFGAQDEVIANVARNNGVPPATLVAYAKVESNGNAFAASRQLNPVTGRPVSTGLFGFTPATAKDYGLNEDTRTNTVKEQVEAAARKYNDDYRALKDALKQEPTPGQQYLAWFLGRDGAIKVLQADPNTPLADVVSKEAIRQNPSILGGNRTASDLVDWSAGRMLSAGAGTGRISGAGLTNLNEAITKLGLTPQEQYLYQTHLTNLWGPGGVNNLDDKGDVKSRSTLYQAVVEHDGRFYNIPTVWDGKIINEGEAAQRVSAVGWDKFPSYASATEADKRYSEMHNFIEKDTKSWFDTRAANKLSDDGRLLSEHTRITLLNAAIHQQSSDLENARKESDRQRKVIGDARMKTLYDMATGDLIDQDTKRPIPITRPYIEASKEYWTPTEYKAALELLSGGGLEDKEPAVVDLARNVNALDIESYQKLATDKLRNKEITTKSYIKWVEANRTAMKDDMPKSAYRSGLDFITNALAAHEQSLGPQGRMNFAQGVLEYETWGRANPNPHPIDANTKAQQIVSRALTLDYEQQVMSLNLSPYFESGKTRSDITLNDVQSARAKLRIEYDSKQIDQTSAALYADQLIKWEAALKKRDAGQRAIVQPPAKK